MKFGMLGLGLSNRKPVIPAAASTNITGLKIISNHTNWIGSVQILAYDDASNEKWTSNIAKDENFLTYASIAVGETATNSTYGTVTSYPDMINNALPDKSNPSSAIGAVQWSTSATSGQEFYGKWSASFTLKEINMCLTTAYGDHTQTWTFKDQDDNILTPITKPSDINDYFQTTSTAYRWYKWTF